MRNKVLLTIATVAVVFIMVSFKQTQPPIGNAITEKVNGVDVYVFSRPTRNYDVIKSGTVTTIIGQCESIANKSARKAADEKADGVIVNLNNNRYEAIKYK
jgi:hypothetical protein